MILADAIKEMINQPWFIVLFIAGAFCDALRRKITGRT